MLTDAFQPDEDGYVRHWVHTGVVRRPYEGSESEENRIRDAVIPGTPAPAPAMSSLGGPGPDGTTWHFHYPGRNIYVDVGAFHHTLGHLSLYASTHLVSNRAVDLPVRVWTANTVDLWQDQQHCLRYTRQRRKKPSTSAIVALSLKPGQNRLAIHLQELAVRDTPFLFALQIMDDADGIRIAVPGHPAATSSLVSTTTWLDNLTVSTSGLESDCPPPCAVETTLDRPSQSVQRSWLSGEKSLSWHEDDVFYCRVEAKIEGQRLRRQIEIPSNLSCSAPGESLTDYRKTYLTGIATTPNGDPARSLFAILARHVLEEADKESDEGALQEGLDHVSGRLDCADFRLAALLRLYALGWGHPEQRNRIRMTALGFRYWTDEPGSDAMAFGSENHTIMFHGCQHVAGGLFPSETFTTSGRSGQDQKDLGRARCLEWLNERHAQGFTEYLSASYTPITAAALLNLADFSDDTEIRTSARTLLDRLLRQLAEHTFDGVTSGPQGRVYRTVLYPHTSGSQGLLSYVLGDQVVTSEDSWSTFLATSEYESPDDLASLTQRQIKRTYPQASHCLQLHKGSAYVISSVQVDAETPMKSGEPGYQQSLWHASLSATCHVFVNHPGTASDQGFGRPGYWYGNGTLPQVTQQESTIFVTYQIPADHPIGFTHAHWPTDALDESIVGDEGWALGRHGKGFVGLWCSSVLLPTDDVLIGRELWARGRQTAWICHCSDTDEAPDMKAFRTSCLSARPRFDPSTGGLFWNDRQIL